MPEFYVEEVRLDHNYRTDGTIEASDANEARRMIEDEIAHNVSVSVDVVEVRS